MANYGNRVMMRLAGAAVGVVIYLVRSQMRHHTYDSSSYDYTPPSLAAFPTEEDEIDKSGELHLAIDLPGFARQDESPGGVELFDGQTTISLQEYSSRGIPHADEVKTAAANADYEDIVVGDSVGGRVMIHGKATGAGTPMSGWVARQDCDARSIVMRVYASTDADAEAVAAKYESAHCIAESEATQRFPAMAEYADEDEAEQEKTFPLYGRVSLDVALPHAYAVLRHVGSVDLSKDSASIWMRERVHRTGVAQDDITALLDDPDEEVTMEGRPKAGRSHFRVHTPDPKTSMHGWIATKICPTRDIQIMVIAPTVRDADKLIAPFDKASCTTADQTPPSWPDASDFDTVHGPA